MSASILTSMKTIIVWYRSDLRIHDHPSRATASEDADHVVPVFIFDKNLLHGKRQSSNRNRFLLQSLEDLKKSLTNAGANLIIRNGDAATELKKLATEANAEDIYYTAGYTPYALNRDKAVKKELETSGINFRSFSGALIVSSYENLHTKAGTDHKDFTPFWKNWMQIGRRDIAKPPHKLSMPTNIAIGSLPKLDEITNKDELAQNALKGGESAGRQRLQDFIKYDIDDYADVNNNMALDRTSRLSSYLHFGCVSPLEIESILPNTKGARSWARQLAWREFYNYILFKNPKNITHEFQEKYRGAFTWSNSKKLLTAWQQGQTGYPAVDAAMRQLNHEGWMHNRGRLIVGSFLTKDLWLDWRDGEDYFMRRLIDGDNPNNNGNWQWIASVGVDPAPVYRRLYNPSTQRDKFDPDGAFTRKYVPELKNVPDKYLSSPWTMPEDIQHEVGCIIGKDYPEPVVDHKQARLAALSSTVAFSLYTECLQGAGF